MALLIELWRWLRATPRRRDVSDAVGVVVVGLLLLATDLTGWLYSMPWARPEPWWHLVPLVIGAAIMLAKRRHPIAALLGGVVVLAGDAAIGGSLAVVLVFWDLLHSAALYASKRAVQIILAITVVVIVVTFLVVWLASGDFRAGLAYGLQSFALYATPIWWGTSVRAQKDLADLAHARAADLEGLTALRQAERLRDERERMARDLHDAISGNLSAIAITTEAALARPDGGADRAALLAARRSSVAALAEMRSMITLLRAGDEPELAPARLSDPVELAGLGVAHGLDLTLPARFGADGLPAAFDQAGFRILQEALTNATKHGAGHVEARLTDDDGTLVIEVSNAVGPARRGDAPGYGLEIMAERATAVGGSCRAGPDGGRWVVQARLPAAGVEPADRPLAATTPGEPTPSGPRNGDHTSREHP
ncbi:sensor histidine kinase [Occultella kanbiaonis]|uniref:sensor histidine kinase n=1 Tax=Occultella kanbiaonis TaxID=2675754 RepID=UPI001A999059|nr:histidine kinase [Occultella kanbiaonis]